MKGLEKEKQKLAHILKSQTALTDELILREPEKVKKFKRQRNELITANEKLENELDRKKIDGEQLREVIEQQSNESEKLMVELKDAKMEKEQKEIENGELKEEIELLKKALELRKIEDAAKEESCRQMKYQIHQLEYKKASLEKDSAEKQIIISKFKVDLKSMEDCILEKDIEIWNLKQEVEEAGVEVVGSVVSIAINNAVKTEEDNLKIQNLLKKNATLVKKVELLIHERDALQGRLLMYWKAELQNPKKGLKRLKQQLRSRKRGWKRLIETIARLRIVSMNFELL